MKRVLCFVMLILLCTSVVAQTTLLNVVVSPPLTVQGGQTVQYYYTRTAAGITLGSGPQIPSSAKSITRREYEFVSTNRNKIVDARDQQYKLTDSTFTTFLPSGTYTQFTPGTNAKFVITDLSGKTTTYTGEQLTKIQSTFGIIPSSFGLSPELLADGGQLEEEDVLIEQMRTSVRYMDVAQFTALQNQFDSFGVSMAQVQRAPNGNYVYDSTFTSDIMIAINGQTTTVTRGTLKFNAEGKPTGELDTTHAYTQTKYENGQFREQGEYSSSGQMLALYTYGGVDGKTWTVQQFDKTIGTLKTLGTGEIILTPKGAVCACGDYNGQRFGVNINTGELVLADGTPFPADQLSKLSNDQKAAVDAARQLQQEYIKTNANAWQRVWNEGNIYNIAQFIFSTYVNWRGLGAYGSLVMGKEDLAERRARVNDAFCKYGLGSDCVVAKICERYSDKESHDNTITQLIPGQAVRAAAHVQGQKTEYSTFKEDGTTVRQWLYHVTYYAASPDKANHVQLRFIYENGHYDWYPEPGKEIQEGGSASAKGPAAIVKYSSRDYTQVCLIYANSIDTGKGRERQLCVPIVAETPVPSGSTPASAPAASGTSNTAPSSTATPGEGF